MYYRLRRDGIDRAVAIQQAQYQLRNLNRQQIAPFLTALENYNNTLTTEFNSLETTRQQELERLQSSDYIQTREDLQQTLTGTKSLQKRLRSLCRIDEYPFADPYYWAGFICQGLA